MLDTLTRVFGDQAEEIAIKLLNLHPAQLGQLMLELYAIKTVRYGGAHPDFYNALQAIQGMEFKPRQEVARWNTKKMKAYVRDNIKGLKRIKKLRRPLIISSYEIPPATPESPELHSSKSDT